MVVDGVKAWSHNMQQLNDFLVMERNHIKKSIGGADLAGNFEVHGHITGNCRVVAPCFLSQPGPTVSCDDLEMT